MAGETITPNMNLIQPGVGTTIGPQYATDQNTTFTLIDQHDHSSGKGVQVSPAGMNINADLTFNTTNSAVSLKSARFSPQASPIPASSPNLACLYVSTADLYYNDVNGNQVRITQSGGIAGSPGSISNLTSPASAAYVSGTQTFVWQSAANTPANLDAASVIFRDLAANSKGVTVNAPTSLASDYSLTWPLLPGATSFMNVDNTGAMGTWAIDNSTLYVSSNTVQVKPQGITQGLLAPRGSVGATAGVGQIAISSGSGSFATGATSLTAVPGTTIQITTTGRPIMLMVAPVLGGANGSYVGALGVGVTAGYINVAINSITASTAICAGQFGDSAHTGSFDARSLPYLLGIDFQSAGTYQYNINISASGASIDATTFNICLIGYEL